MLKKACLWLSISKGRASEYVTLVEEFFKDQKRSREHFLAYNESCEIIDIYELWAPYTCDFPGIEKKIKEIFNKGPIIREHERPDRSSNRTRNDAFVHLLAGKFLRAGIKVLSVDGIPAKSVTCRSDADITFESTGSLIDIECKRPQTEKAFDRRAKEAQNQLRGLNRLGIIAIDCSALIRPPGTLLKADSAKQAEEMLSDTLENKLKTKAPKHMKASILGFIFFARIPSITKAEVSPILSSRGDFITYYRPDSISTLIIINNQTSSHPEVLRLIYQRLKASK